MNMKIDLDKIVDKVKSESTGRGPKTIYLDLEVFKKFQAKCENMGISSSRMIEEFMRQFLHTKGK